MNRITCVLLGRIGDAITATGFLDALEAKFPAAERRLLLTEACRGLAPLLGKWTLIRPAQLLEKSQLLIDLNPAPSKSATALIALARAKEKLGFRKKRLNFPFTRQVEEPREDEPMLARYGRLAAALDAPYHPRPRLKKDDAEKAAAAEQLRALGWRPDAPSLLVHAGNFKKFDNRWPEENFVALAKALDVPVFFLAGPGELEPVTAIAKACGRPVVPPGSLARTAGVLRNMSGFLCNITGTTHLAHALDVPTFGLYSGYTNAVWRPAGAAGAVSKEWESCRSIPVETAVAGARQFLAGLTNR